VKRLVVHFEEGRKKKIKGGEEAGGKK